MLVVSVIAYLVVSVRCLLVLVFSSIITISSFKVSGVLHVMIAMWYRVQGVYSLRYCPVWVGFLYAEISNLP